MFGSKYSVSEGIHPEFILSLNQLKVSEITEMDNFEVIYCSDYISLTLSVCLNVRPEDEAYYE